MLMTKKRVWDTGTIRPYRPCPTDFSEMYLLLGFSKELREHYRTNDRCLWRWVEERGGEELRLARAAVTGSSLKPGRRSRRSRYVLGRTLTAVSPHKTEE